MMKRTGTNGFTLVDLLVAIACVAVLIAIPACMVEKAQEVNQMAHVVACKANFIGIGRGIMLYRVENNDKFPLLFTEGQPESDIKATHAARNIDELKTNLTGSEAAMQNMWVLIDKGFLGENAFKCPADKDYVARNFTNPADRSKRKVGWSSAAQFSYGLHSPYESTVVDGKPVRNPAPLGSRMKASFVIMADKNPSQNTEPATGVGPDKSPSNHGALGQVYLTNSGQVEAKQGNKNSEVNGDDIYTTQSTGSTVPVNSNDQYIVRHPALPAK
ncbi:MAG: type II secretion system protein [bacterium]|nr:type II secretion system protein [bacterium]